MEPEICTKILKKLSEKLGAKSPANTHGYSMVKSARLNDAFLEVFLTASKPSRRLITAAKTKEKEKKVKAKKYSKIEMPKDVGHCLVQNFDFCACPSPNVVKCDGKKGKLLCCKCLFHQIKANLAEIQPENHQNVQKNTFLAKSSGSQWVKY